jgi:hypothetical protein
MSSATWRGRLLRAGAATISLMMLAAIVGFLVWATRRGFDITDEGSYLVSATAPRDPVMMPNFDYWLTALLWRLSGGDLWALRLIGLVTTLSAAAMLMTAVRPTLDTLGRPASRACRVQEVALLLSGALLGYTWFLPTPSYNWMNAWAVTVGAGALVAGLQRAHDRSGHGWFALAGACLAGSFLVKFPSALAMGATAVAAVVLWPGWARRSRLAALGLMAAGAVGVAAIFFAWNPPGDWWLTFSRGLGRMGDARPGMGRDLLLRNPWQVLAYVVAPGPKGTLAFVVAIALGGAILLAARLSGRAPTQARGAALATCLLAAVAAAAFWLRSLPTPEYFLHGARFWFAWLVVCAFAGGWAALQAPHTSLRQGRWILGAVLLVAPFAGAIGTSNAININMMFSFAPWFVLMIAALRVVALDDRHRTLGALAQAALSVFCAWLIIGGASTAPYRLVAPLAAQTTPVQLGRTDTTVLVDPASAAFYADLRQLAASAGFRRGDDVLAFYDVPGAVFAMGGRSPATPWFTETLARSGVAERMLAIVGADRVSRAWILESDRSRAWLLQLDPALGINFPVKYRFVAELPVPYANPGGRVRLWQPVD